MDSSQGNQFQALKLSFPDSVRSPSMCCSASTSTSQLDDDDDHDHKFNTCTTAHLSLNPYDPLTNYLSPRPQYLRYNPNRHREMLNHRQRCHSMKEDGSFPGFAQDFLDAPSNKGTESVHSEENDSVFDDEEEEEEFDEEEEETDEFEEKSCSLKGILKFFILMVVMALSTFYIFSVGSFRTSPTELQGLKDGYHRLLLNHSREAIPKNLSAGEGMIRCTLAREAQVGFPELNQQSTSYLDHLGMVHMVMDGKNLVLVKKESSGDDINEFRMLESLNEQNSDTVVVDKKRDTILDHFLPNVDTAVCEILSRQDFAETIILDGEINIIGDSPNGVTGQDIDLLEKPDFLADQKGSGSSSGKDKLSELGNNLAVTRVEESLRENARVELNNGGAEGTSEITRYIVGKAKGRHMELGQIHIASIAAFCLFAIVLASLVYITHLRVPSKTLQQPLEAAELEESNQKQKLIESQAQKEIECLQKKFESICLKPSTMAAFSLEEIRKGLSYNNQETKVEFLGEIVIGGMVSSSCRTRTRTIKRCGKTSNEAEESIDATSHVESGTDSATLIQPDDTASTDFPSYGSFTAEKKIPKKQGTKDGSLQMVTTPVRRSSRLKNRCIISPQRSSLSS